MEILSKIGIDGIPLASAKTGIGHYTLELSRALAAIDPDDEFQLIAPIPLASDDHLPRNLRKVHAPKRKLWWVAGLPLYIRRSSLALFHGTNYDIPLWSPCPTVLSIHDLSLLLYPQTHLKHLVRRARYRLPLMARSATRIITATEHVKREVTQHLRVDPAKIAVTPYAPRTDFRPIPRVETEEVRRRLGVEDIFILFVGTIEPRKNLITLLRAFGETQMNTDLRAQLVIAGQEGWLMGEMSSYIEREGLKGRIRFTGYIADEDLRALYSSCAVSVYPSLYEGFGFPPLEAMSCGAPVIAADVPSLHETVGQAALRVPPTDVQQLARALVEMLGDEQKRAHYSRAGMEWAAQFTWERTAQQTLAVYRDAISAKQKRK
ncbi:MAG TPA: glycosyltransferase family 1 protein [Pyrinomonadaceae bacterium]|nr:glycosyltransferase family 1 protein [Pyrinomonadaceae bacterium]